MAHKDLSGMKFGRLTAIERCGTRHGYAEWLCQCDCGNTTIVTSGRLNSKGTKSCGCLMESYLASKRTDLTGKEFGFLTVIKPTGKRKKDYAMYYLCRCSCGQEAVVSSNNLASGHTRSCGCLLRRKTAKNRDIRRIIEGIRQRCLNPKCPAYKDYGGRGITVCVELLGGDAKDRLIEAIGPRPSPSHSIDRIDNNGNYDLSNIRWATRVEQSSNTRKSRILVIRGEAMTAAAAADVFRVSRQTVLNWIKKGMTVEEMLKRAGLHNIAVQEI
jgi:hypothetical protein